MSTQINHVSVNARNLQESVDFYIDLLGAEPIPTPNFGIPVQWLALGPPSCICSSATSSRPAIITSASLWTMGTPSIARRSGATPSTATPLATI